MKTFPGRNVGTGTLLNEKEPPNPLGCQAFIQYCCDTIHNRTTGGIVMQFFQMTAHCWSSLSKNHLATLFIHNTDRLW